MNVFGKYPIVRSLFRRAFKSDGLENISLNIRHGYNYIFWAKSTRHVSCTRMNRAKSYVEHENAYYRSVMKESSRDYAFPFREVPNFEGQPNSIDVDSILCKDWSQKDTCRLVEDFKTLSEIAYRDNMDISMEKFDTVVDSVTDGLYKMTNAQLESICESLWLWPQTESVHTRNFVEFWAALDDMFQQRLHTWDLNTILRFSDLMHKLNLSRKSDFVHYGMRKLYRKALKLTPEQFVQTMFYICATRKKQADMMDLEKRFEQVMDVLSLNEIGIACAGFFKSSSVLREPLTINKLMSRLTAEADSVGSVTACSILKLLRNSMRLANVDKIHRMLDALTPEIDRLSLMACVQIAIVTTPITYLHRPSLESVALKFAKNSSDARLKDLERIALAYTLFGWKSDSGVFESIMKELRRPDRQQEIAKHGKSLACCLSYLATVEIYPLDLIDRVLDKEFISNIYGDLAFKSGKIPAGREILVLARSVEIERPDHEGNQITPKLAKALFKRFSDYLPNDSGMYALNLVETMMLEVKTLLARIRGGKDYVFGTHVLPHFQRGVYVFADDKDGKPVDVTTLLSTYDVGEINRIPNRDYTWYILVFFGRYSSICNTKENVGPSNMLIRQLKKLGYVPKNVSWDDWLKMPDDESKIKYLNDTIYKET